MVMQEFIMDYAIGWYNLNNLRISDRNNKPFNRLTTMGNTTVIMINTSF